MDNFKAVYKILSTLEKAMDYPEFDPNQINAEVLGVSEERWSRFYEGQKMEYDKTKFDVIV